MGPDLKCSPSMTRSTRESNGRQAGQGNPLHAERLACPNNSPQRVSIVSAAASEEKPSHSWDSLDPSTWPVMSPSADHSMEKQPRRLQESLEEVVAERDAYRDICI